MKSKKKSKSKWFIPVRGSYLPSSGEGWFTYIPYFSYLLFSFILAWEIDVSRVVKVYLTLVQWAFAFMFMTWLARTKS
jgi:hypothetical protein